MKILKPSHLFYLFLLGIWILLINPAFAIAEFKPNNEQWRQIKEIEIALNQTQTLQSKFIQSNPDSSYQTGALMISRPGKMRVEYDAPDSMLLVANYGEFVIANTAIEETTRYPLSQTPLAWLLSDSLSFDDPSMIISDFKNDNGTFKITLQNKELPEAGALALLFTVTPLILRQWEVIDSLGNLTRVTLENPIPNLEIADDKFNLPRYAPKDK